MHILHILQILHILHVLHRLVDQGAQGVGGGSDTGLQRLFMVGPTEGETRTVYFRQSNVVLISILLYRSLEQIDQEKRLRSVDKPENLSLQFR